LTIPRWLGLAVLPLALASPAAAAEAAAAGGTPVDLTGIDRIERVVLAAPWRYHRGDAPGLVAPGLDDSRWPLVDPALPPGGLPPGFDGAGVFRLTLVAPPALAGRALALRLQQHGASEIWLDGRRVASHGSLLDGTPFTPLASAVLQIAPGTHLLAVRYACPRFADYHRAGVAAGFTASLALAERALPAEARAAATYGAATWLFTGVFLSFALLHGALFAFHRESRENLFFALLCAANAVLAYFMFGRHVSTDPRFMLVSEPAMNVTGLLFAAAVLLFVRETFGPRPGPRLLGAVVLSLATVGGWAAAQPGRSLTTVFLLMLAACAEALRGVVVAVVRRRPGARLVGTGVACLAAGFAIGLLAYLGPLPRTQLNTSFIPFGSVILLLFFSSLHLSRRFAQTNRELRRQLAEVERLSAEKLVEERRAQQQEMARRLLAAEVERKTAELEEARRLQTSLLPRELPRLPNLLAAARMVTATEVGGDYYDFDVGEGGEVTVAIGDATGHGLRAGTLVTATKGLFGVLAREPDLRSALSRSAASIRRMNLRALAMALTLVRFRGGVLRVAAAGMPPVLVHRAADDSLQALPLAGMPLGAMAHFPYAEEVVTLEPGDTVLLMSDGLPERLDPADEMLGYERTAELFREAAAAGDPADIVERLFAAGDHWARGRPTDDDVTLVVLRHLG
jgi:serine phosphatase RsbU (regulator of sigma subunit)